MPGWGAGFGVEDKRNLPGDGGVVFASWLEVGAEGGSGVGSDKVVRRIIIRLDDRRPFGSVSARRWSLCHRGALL